MTASALLKNKRAVVFGAGGSIASRVAVEFAAEGAEVFISGRNKSAVDTLAKQIGSNGGRVHASIVDAFDDVAVNRYMDETAKQAGKIDIAFNAVGPRAIDYGNGKLAVDLSIQEFMLPLMTVVKSQFITARAAIRHMLKQRSGVVLFLTGSPARGHVEGATSIGTAFGAIETLMENLAVQIGPAGVRTVCIRTTANTDSRSILDTMERASEVTNLPVAELLAATANGNFLKVAATVADTARAAVLASSDYARMMTGTVLNVTAGAAFD
jgi:3-oxoacyl-[acyl-carrier protein] reductase